ncbi:hypothetical protein ACFXKD_30030 [Nocardiopsis aegyptia]|uniref:hypothetical protein n=1 Tax=Nocardiopsis aegyptia TaxID=220378 RepID=UPI0036734A7F
MPHAPAAPDSPTVRLLAVAAALLAALVVLVAVVAPAPAAADGTEQPTTPAAHVAALMAEEPEGRAVVVSDILAGEYDLERVQEQVRAEFDRLGVPYQVFVSTGLLAFEGEEFLAAVQERSGREGLYVLLNAGQTVVAATTTPGTDLPTRDAASVLMSDESYDYETPVPQLAAGYVDALLDPDVAERAERALNEALNAPDEGSERAEPGDEAPSAWQEFLDDMSPDSSNGPENTGTVAGMVGGTALGFGLTAAVLVRWRRSDRRVGFGSWAWAGGSVAVAAAVVVAGMVHVASAPAEESAEDSATPGPEAAESADLLAEPPYVAATERVDRVIGAWEGSPVFADPLITVDPAALEELDAAVAAAPVPVHVAAVPVADTDESDGDPEVLAHALAHTRGEDGVYVVVDARSGRGAFALLGVDPGAETYDLSTAMSDAMPSESGVEVALALMDGLGGARLDPEAEATVPVAARLLDDTIEDEEPTAPLGRYAADGLLPGLLILGPLVGVLLCLAFVPPYLLVRLVRATPGRRLRPMARREAERAIAALKAAGDLPAGDQAVRDLDTALIVLGEDPDELDLVGATVLARRAARRLEEGSAGGGGRVCMVDPLHDFASGKGGIPKANRSDLHLCGRCLRLTPALRTPLRVTGPTGRRVPHLSLDERSWVTSWYGTRENLSGEKLLEESRAR